MAFAGATADGEAAHVKVASSRQERATVRPQGWPATKAHSVAMPARNRVKCRVGVGRISVASVARRARMPCSRERLRQGPDGSK